MKEYKIFSGWFPAELEEKVNEALKNGWKLQGGIAAYEGPQVESQSFTGRAVWLYQAMTREE